MESIIKNSLNHYLKSDSFNQNIETVISKLILFLESPQISNKLGELQSYLEIKKNNSEHIIQELQSIKKENELFRSDVNGFLQEIIALLSEKEKSKKRSLEEKPMEKNKKRKVHFYPPTPEKKKFPLSESQSTSVDEHV